MSVQIEKLHFLLQEHTLPEVKSNMPNSNMSYSGSWKTYWWPCVVKSTHGDFEASSLCDQDVLLRYPHILKGDASGIRTPLAHVHLLQAYDKHKDMLSCVCVVGARHSVKLLDCTPEVD